MKILSFAEGAVLIQFKQKISVGINSTLVALSRALENHPIIQYVVPSYCSLLVGFKGTQVSLKQIKKLIRTEYKSLADDQRLVGKRWRLPVCYDAPFALDMPDVCRLTGLSKKSIIKYHAERSYHVFGVGFLPGFPYLGKLSKPLLCPRRQEPRLNVLKGAVGIAGRQTGIYPADSPGGWQIIGATPIPIFRPQMEEPFLLQPGDQVAFHSISEEAFGQIEAQILDEIFEWKSLSI